MNSLSLTTIISTLLISILGTLVLIRNIKDRTYQLFGIYCFFVAIWSIATFLSLVITDKDEMLFWIRLVMALATAQSIVIFLFVLTYPNHSFTIQKRVLILILFVGMATFILCLTPFVFSDIELSSVGEVQKTVVGPGIILFILVAIGAIFSSVILSLKKYIGASGVIKIHFQYIFFSLVLMYTGIIFFSFTQAVFFQNPNYVYLGSLFTLPFIILTTYAILRYRFMDIKVVIRKGVIYSISLLLTLAVYTYLALLLKDTIEQNWQISPTWTAVILIALVALGFPPLKSIVEKAVNTLFKGRKSIDLAVKELREKIAEKTDLDVLAGLISGEIKKYLDVGEVKFYIINHRDKRFIHKSEDGLEEMIERNNDLLRYFEKYHEPLVRDEITHLLEEREGEFEKDMLRKAEKELKKRQASLALPFFTEDEVFGVVFLGERAQNKAYTVEDVKYLEQLREQTQFVVANAILYKETMDSLRERVQETV